MVGYEELDKNFGVDEEKLKKMSEYTGAEGGKLELPHIGDSVRVTLTSEPYEVSNPKIEETTGQKVANFIRVRDSQGIEYDMPISRTIWLQLRAEMRKYGIRDLKGRTFAIIGGEWKDAPEEYRANACQCEKCRGRVKTYTVAYKGTSVETEGQSVESTDL